MKKSTKNFSPPPPLFNLSVLNQNKGLYNSRKRGQCSIDKRNIGLEYALLRLTKGDKTCEGRTEISPGRYQFVLTFDKLHASFNNMISNL